MAIEAIQGKVRSEPLNRNFSYLDSEIGYAAGYVGGETQLHYTGDQLTGVTTPMSSITLTYDDDSRLSEVTETFAERVVTVTLNYDEDGALISVDKDVTQT
mgnify:CR=1 FL=1